MNEQWIIGCLEDASTPNRIRPAQWWFDNENERLRQQLNRDVQVAKDYEATIERMRIERDTARLEGKIRAKPTDLEAEVERLTKRIEELERERTSRS